MIYLYVYMTCILKKKKILIMIIMMIIINRFCEPKQLWEKEWRRMWKFLETCVHAYTRVSCRPAYLFFFLFPVVSSYDESVPRQQTKFLKYHGWGKVEKHACLIVVVCFFPWPCTRINKNKSKNKHGELKKNTVVVASRNSGGWNSDSIGTVTQRGLL